MARKSSNENEFIMDTETELESFEEDLLAESNRRVLSSFGNSVSKRGSGNSAIFSAGGMEKSTPLELLKERMGAKVPEKKSTDTVTAEEIDTYENTVTPEAEAKADTKEKEKEMSLLEKLKRYTIDEKGHDVTEDAEPLYKLQSVADIIKSDGNDLINRLSEKYNVTVDTLGKEQNENSPSDTAENPDADGQETDAANEGTASPTPTTAFKKMADESKQRFEKSIFDELFTEKAAPEAAEESIPDISDIDNSSISEGSAPEEHKKTDTATIRFTPIKDEKGNTGRINISSTTKIIDIEQELTSEPAADTSEPNAIFEADEFDLFAPKNEITDLTSAKSAAKKFAYRRRNGFLSMLFCSVCTFIAALFLTPLLSDKVISSTKSVVTFCSCLLFATILANIDMFADILNLFKRGASHDCLVSLCAVLSIPLCIWSIANGENIYHIVFLTLLIMLSRSVMSFMKRSTDLSNVRLIKNKRNKYAVSFIKDKSTALAMAKNAIDGDVLIAAPKKAEFISDFMKFSLFKKKFSGNVHIIFIVALALSVLGAFMGYFYYKTAFAALYCAFAAACIAAMPAVMFSDVLPLYSASKKLSKKGAMISGTFAADSIELANAAVIETAEIFPAGSIVLKSFKVLSDNDIDKTIVNAAALTEEIGSPLAPIFNKIAGTNTSYKKPDSDTIKYEERLGLSGWVDNELLFIGNRTLMEAHGIEVPSIEIDKKILRSGYFPVYVGTGGKACALIVIQYEVRSDIQNLLRKISRLGITMLIKNCDPNVSEEMICDYFGLYDDSVKVMTNVGSYMYDNATAGTGTVSAPAGFMGSRLNLLRIMACASRIRISNNILSVFYILASILGVWYFAFSSFAQSSGMLPGSALLLFEVLASLFALIAFLFRKP